MELADGEFLVDDIIGLSVISKDGEDIGMVSEIFGTGSNDIFVVTKGEKEYLIPAIRDVIKKIDIENKKIIIEVMEGLLE